MTGSHKQLGAEASEQDRQQPFVGPGAEDDPG